MNVLRSRSRHRIPHFVLHGLGSSASCLGHHARLGCFEVPIERPRPAFHGRTRPEQQPEEPAPYLFKIFTNFEAFSMKRMKSLAFLMAFVGLPLGKRNLKNHSASGG